MATVLLVEDDPDQLEMRALVLETERHQVAAARNRVEAMRLFTERKPDIVLMDLRLPRISDGLALVKELRAQSEAVPILVLSGWPDDLRDRPELPRIDKVLPKPVRSQNLLALIDRLTA